MALILFSGEVWQMELRCVDGPCEGQSFSLSGSSITIPSMCTSRVWWRNGRIEFDSEKWLKYRRVGDVLVFQSDAADGDYLLLERKFHQWGVGERTVHAIYDHAGNWLRLTGSEKQRFDQRWYELFGAGPLETIEVSVFPSSELLVEAKA